MQIWRDLDGDRRRAFAALMVAMAVSSMGFGAIFPVLPLLVTGRGDGVGTLAAMASAYIVSSFAFQYPMAALADRFGHRRVLAIAVLANAPLALFYVLHLSPVLLVAVRVLQGLANGAAEPAARALVSDLVPDARRGEAFGALASADMVGILVGPLLGGGIAAVLPLEYVFILQGGLCLVAGVAFVVVSRGAGDLQQVAAAAEGPLAGLRGLLTVDLVGLGILAAAGSYLFGMYDTVWVLFMQRIGADTAMTGFSITIFAVPLLFLSAPAGRLGDRFGRRGLAITGTLGMGLIAGLYPILPGIPWVLAMGVIEGSVFALVRPNLYALIAATAPAGMEARTQAAAGVMGIAGNLIAPALAAFFWARDYHLAFYSGSGIVLGLTALGAALALRPGNRIGKRRVDSAVLPMMPGEPRSPAIE